MTLDELYAYQLYTMDTTSKFSSETVGEVSEEINVEGSGNVEDKGFFGLLAQSIFEVSQFVGRTNLGGCRLIV